MNPVSWRIGRAAIFRFVDLKHYLCAFRVHDILPIRSRWAPALLTGLITCFIVLGFAASRCVIYDHQREVLRVGSYKRLTKLAIPSSFPEELPTIIVVIRSQRFSSVSLGSNVLTKDELTPHWIIHVAELHEPIGPYPHLPIWPKRTFLWSFALSDLKAQL